MNLLDEPQLADARRQLGLDATYEAFFLAIEADIVHGDLNEALDTMAADIGSMWASDAMEAIAPCIGRVRLPRGFMVVGLAPAAGGEPIYGVCDFSAYYSGE